MVEAEESPGPRPVETGWLERRLIFSGRAAAGMSAPRPRPFHPAMQSVLHSRDRKVYNLMEKIPKLQAPILFFWTTHNPTCPWPVAEKVHQSVPGSRFVLVDKSGHWPQYERPEEFNRTLLEFLDDSQDEILIDTYRRRYW